MPEPPYLVYGLVTGDGTPQASLTVTITNVTLGGSDTCTTDSEGHYIYDDLAALPNGYASGNTIRVSVYSDPLLVYQTFTAASEPEEKEINLTYVTKLLTDSVSLSDELIKAITQLLTDSITLSDAFESQTMAIMLLEELTLSDELPKDVTMPIGHDVAFQPNAFQKDAFQGLLNSISMTDTLTNAISILLTESITLSDGITHAVGITYTESITITDESIIKDITQFLADSITLSDSLSKDITQIISDSITLTDVRTMLLIYRFYVEMSLSKALEIELFTPKALEIELSFWSR